MKLLTIPVILLLTSLPACQNQAVSNEHLKISQKLNPSQQKGSRMIEKITKTNAEWKKLLTPEQYGIMREKGTERAFSGALWNNHEKGIYECAACDLDLFGSETKFESGTGWPSFWAPIAQNHIVAEEDRGFFMRRTEVKCARCDAHLGHVFEDGPAPTGLRYCINSAALKFVKK